MHTTELILQLPNKLFLSLSSSSSALCFFVVLLFSSSFCFHHVRRLSNPTTPKKTKQTKQTPEARHPRATDAPNTTGLGSPSSITAEGSTARCRSKTNPTPDDIRAEENPYGVPIPARWLHGMTSKRYGMADEDQSNYHRHPAEVRRRLCLPTRSWWSAKHSMLEELASVDCLEVQHDVDDIRAEEPPNTTGRNPLTLATSELASVDCLRRKIPSGCLFPLTLYFEARTHRLLEESRGKSPRGAYSRSRFTSKLASIDCLRRAEEIPSGCLFPLTLYFEARKHRVLEEPASVECLPKHSLMSVEDQSNYRRHQSRGKSLWGAYSRSRSLLHQERHPQSLALSPLHERRAWLRQKDENLDPFVLGRIMY
ncbi:hypothetical protein LZ554_004250 [Drepanopeziza brunnea f. sp. 'monogermtubi']|nr:hypothetical protein LZ554_004250 [Drepanopeziza brunnea f. sp. 'monogermtubi']